MILTFKMRSFLYIFASSLRLLPYTSLFISVSCLFLVIYFILLSHKILNDCQSCYNTFFQLVSKNLPKYVTYEECRLVEIFIGAVCLAWGLPKYQSRMCLIYYV